MQQHPIPQQISSYEFRLIGDMTLKQFLKFSAGLLFGVFFYKMPGLAFYFRIPLAILSVLLGTVSAFLPIYDRPLEAWIVIFLNSVYSPTLFLWKRRVSPAPVKVLDIAPPKPKFKKVKTLNKEPMVREFLETIPQASATFDSSAPPPPPPPRPKKLPKKPQEKKDLSFEESLKRLKEAVKEEPAKITATPTYEEASMPATPTTPNIVSGIVLDEEGATVEGAIVEIQDLEGNPIRAMRTNRLGQFQTATPLPNGDYLIIVEKEPYRFDIIKLKAEGEIIPPIRIQAKSAQVS